LYHVDPVLEGADGEGDEGEEVRVRKGDSADVAYRQRCTNSKSAIEEGKGDDLDGVKEAGRNGRRDRIKKWREKWGKKTMAMERIEQGIISPGSQGNTQSRRRIRWRRKRK
jgi:hypothetical protein